MMKQVKAKNKNSYSSNSLVFSRWPQQKDPKLKKVAVVGSDKFDFELHQKKGEKNCLPGLWTTKTNGNSWVFTTEIVVYT